MVVGERVFTRELVARCSPLRVMTVRTALACRAWQKDEDATKYARVAKLVPAFELHTGSGHLNTLASVKTFPKLS